MILQCPLTHFCVTWLAETQSLQLPKCRDLSIASSRLATWCLITELYGTNVCGTVEKYENVAQKTHLMCCKCTVCSNSHK